MMIKKNIIKYVLEFVAGLLIFIFVCLGTLIIFREVNQKSRLGEAEPYNETEGISELREIELGGVSQYILIEGQSKGNEMCLFLHGGPGLSAPYGVSSRALYPELTDSCTAVYWDQRGSGKSYQSDLDLASITYEQLSQDAIELVDYLLETFDKEKIYLIGSSWGTILGMRLAHDYPSKFHAYFGIGQVVNAKQADHLTYDWLLNEYSTLGDEESVALLKQIGKPPYKKEKNEMIFQRLIAKSEAYIKNNDGEKGVSLLELIQNVYLSPDLTLWEVYHTLIKGPDMIQNESPLWKETRYVNLNEEIKQIEVPVYFLQGMYDQITPNELLTPFFNTLEAPEKEIILLEESAHYLNNNDQLKVFEFIKSKIN